MSVRVSTRGLAALACVAAAALAAPATAKAPVKPKPGMYTGTVGAFIIHFRVSSDSKQVLKLDSSYVAQCSGASNNQEFVPYPTMTIKKGHFGGSKVVHPKSGITQHFSVSGHFTASDKAAGTVSARFSFLRNALPPCHSTGMFTAARAGK